jgi:D-alanyl-D-alanine carboxypeptidase (penicillin-binding protein 5/6)
LIACALAALLLLPATPAGAKQRRRATVSAQAPPSASPTPVLAPGELPLAAQGAIVIDESSGDPLYEKNSAATFYPASTTKILTALIIIESGDLDHEVVIQPEDEKVEPSSLEMKPGEQHTRLEMLYGLMLKSANDVAQALARDNAGSIAAFAEKMNQRARQLGAVNSHFVNPHGLHNKDHYTTPRDLSLIARAAMQQPLFRKIVSTVDYTWNSPAGPVPLRNHNKLLTRYPGCTGLKTGYTVPAQQVLVSAALRDGREVISVVMHTDHPGIWEDSKTLLTYGFSHLPNSRENLRAFSLSNMQ